MEEKLQGIVLGGINFGENDKILKIFTLGKGVVSAKIKGVKKAGAKLKFASEPFCFAEFIFSTSQDKRTVIGASLIESFYPIREDIEKYFCSSAILEFDKLFLMENMVSEKLFFLTINALKEIAYGEENCKSVLVKFLLSSLRESGYALNLNGCYKCGCKLKGRVFFDYLSGGFTCEECKERGREINLETFLSLENAENGEILTDRQSILALRLLSYYIANKPEENIKSLGELLNIVKMWINNIKNL